ncbi:MAG: hypothetical protein PHG71_05690 [Kiritimatiellae bacterium]|nr:hypothetical protein [Kiritimatiellia bacterium]
MTECRKRQGARRVGCGGQGARGLIAPGLALACASLCLAPVKGIGAESGGKEPDAVVSRFRIGPFFEYRATREGGTYWAVRPFYSKLSDPVSDTRVTDTVWPLGTFHRDREQSWWRLLLAYGSDNDVTLGDSAWKAALFPLWFQGRSRQGEDYRALFPVYGHLPHVLLMDDIDFVLFPLYLNYEVNGVERDYYLWPIFSRTGEEPGVTRTGLFPIYGETNKRGVEEHCYTFWPFWTSAVYNGRNPGSSWMLFPLYGRVRREKERQTLILPPFFSRAETDAAVRWRTPWPFIESLTAPDVQKRSFWPFYGSVDRDDERRWYAAWPLIEHFNLSSKGGRTRRSRFFPFYVDEKVYRKDTDQEERLVASYRRIWPLYARDAKDGDSRERVLALSLIRHSGGIERNWAPFWTLYERTEQVGEIRHDALWGLLKYRKASQPGKVLE